MEILVVGFILPAFNLYRMVKLGDRKALPEDRERMLNKREERLRERKGGENG